MKSRLGRAALAAVVLCFVGSAAAQRPPGPAPDVKPKDVAPLPRLKFPASVVAYEQYLGRMLTLIHRLAGLNGVKPGAVDECIRLTKECAHEVEADGVVTEREAGRCAQVMRAHIPIPKKPGH